VVGELGIYGIEQVLQVCELFRLVFIGPDILLDALPGFRDVD